MAVVEHPITPNSATLTAIKTDGSIALHAPATPPLASPPTVEPVSKEIVFVDPNVPDYQTLLDGIRQDAQVIILDAGQDGVAQSTAVLAEQNGVSAVHIISHGGPGSLQLGSASLPSMTFSSYLEQLQS